MFIVNPGLGPITILDSVAGHRKTFAALTTFLASEGQTIELPAAGTCHLCPDWRPLRALRVVKSAGNLRLQEAGNGVLQITAPPELLNVLFQGLLFEPGEGGHHHPEQYGDLGNHIDPTSIDIIFEVDEWADDPEAP